MKKIKLMIFLCAVFSAAMCDAESAFTEDHSQADFPDAAEYSQNVSSGDFSLGRELDSAYDDGIKLMYNLRFDEAERKFRDIIAVSSDHPAGYFAVAALSWWKYAQNFDIEGAAADSLEKEFLANSDAAIKVASAMLKRGGKKDQAYFFLGSAYGLKGRWYAVQRRWLKAYSNGNRGRKFLRKCVKVNPNVYDAYLGLGIFDYYADTLPGILRIPALLFVNGDRSRGIKNVRLAVEKGRFFSSEARIFLVEILTRHEKDTDSALKEARALRNSDPQNKFFWLGEILTLVHALKWESVVEESEAFIKGQGHNGEEWISRQLGLVYLSAGDAMLAMKEYENALIWFTGGIEKTGYPEKGWVTYCYLRRAQVYDLLGNRDYALRDYEAVLSRDNFWDSKKYAKSGRKKAPDFGEVYRQLTEE